MLYIITLYFIFIPFIISSVVFISAQLKSAPKKIGENMNRKIMILMVAVVATVLPAVAVADVMITGHVHGTQVGVPDAFTVQPGSNYGSANTMTGFTWTSVQTSESENLGSINVGVMSNETIYLINVLDINFTQSGYFNVTVYVPTNSNAPFGTGSAIYFSNTPFTSPITTSSFTATGSQVIKSVLLDSATPTGGTTVSFEHVTQNDHIYIGFEVGAGSSDGSFSLTMSFTS